MDPFVAWMTIALAGVAGFAGFMVRWAIQHLESDLAYSRRSAQRGVSAAEEAAAAAERHRT